MKKRCGPADHHLCGITGHSEVKYHPTQTENVKYTSARCDGRPFRRQSSSDCLPKVPSDCPLQGGTYFWITHLPFLWRTLPLWLCFRMLPHPVLCGSSERCQAHLSYLQDCPGSV
ncbi:hypothetical protein CHARACLAT_018386 [Characodon lateralis]|uniref:Uncharacterized protein n=1 Tax=Characodon lateralis TaxID=208331 RepID=A0ABU7E1M2_9TELE|nr:hypothetical protein [Characodon lateralis]